jgi:signal peptidase II
MRSGDCVQPPSDHGPLEGPASRLRAPRDGGQATGLTPPDTAPPRRAALHWPISGWIIAIDQLSKALVVAFLPLYESRTVIPGLFDLTHVRNEGVAFGILNANELPYKAVVTTGLALIALCGIAWYARQVRHDERFARFGLALILGGALGNLIDRVRLGYVVDFVDVYWQQWHFWAFNVADASITIGAVLVFFELLVARPPHVSDPV